MAEMAERKEKSLDDTNVAEANLARLAVRDLKRTMDQLIEVDGRALSLAARAGQMFLDGKVPEHRQEELVRTMEQVVDASVEARRVIKDVNQMVSFTKAASPAAETGRPAETKAEPSTQQDTASPNPGEQQRQAVRRQMRLTKMRL